MRHAKSSWDDPEQADHDRPLSPRGRRAALAMARFIGHLQVRPKLVLCSSAVRALQTFEPIGKVLGDSAELSVEDDLYAASSGQLLTRLRRVPPGTGAVLLVGHNPGIEELTIELAGGSGPAASSKVTAKFPTAALAALSAQVHWAGLGPGKARLESLTTPAELD